MDETERRILALIENLDRRLAAVEQLLAGQQVVRNVKVPTHSLESSSKSMSESGLTTELKVMVCSMCHRVIKEEKYFTCHECGSVICDSCVIMHNSKAHCEDCLRQNHLDISKRDYLTLICIANEITDVKTISELTLISKENVENSIINLVGLNLISHERKLFGLVDELKLTDEGRTAIALYRPIYGRDEDVAIFGQALRKYLVEREGFKIGS